MKNTCLWIVMFIYIWALWAFAYTASSDLQLQITQVSERFEEIISERWEQYRDLIIQKIEYYRWIYAGDEMREYILDTLEHNIKLVDIASSKYLGSYSIDDNHYGTQTSVSVTSSTRTMQVNALPNHETWDFPNSGNPNTISAQSLTYSFPVSWTYTGDQTWAHTPGVAINGVKMEPETNERVECTSGQQYKIEAIQDFVDLGLDFHNAHVQPTGEYHYHGSFDLVADMFEGEDLVHVGFAQDGFLIYYSKKWTYTPSYQIWDTKREGTSCSYRGKSVTIDNTIPDGTYVSDWEYVEWSWNLDVCNGIWLDGEYIYLITDQYPYIGRCLNGEYSSSWPAGGGPGWSAGWPPPRR